MIEIRKKPIATYKEEMIQTAEGMVAILKDVNHPAYGKKDMLTTDVVVIYEPSIGRIITATTIYCKV